MIYNQSTRGGAKARRVGGDIMDVPQTENLQPRELATIGKSVVIKGELSGSEDLYIDGQVEGSIDLRNHSLTVGPSGNVKAGIQAKSIVIQGKVDGSLTASDRLDLRKSAVVTGDVSTQRIAIEEGAFLKGKVDIQKEIGKGASS
jgi:cytoskeletal protein CcmA (bactofilin family)